jgi:D-aspartate ligase
VTIRRRDRPAAIVLCTSVTGLATVRALGKAGVDVHAFVFDAHDPVRFSRYATKIQFVDKNADDDALLDCLVHYSNTLGHRPVVLPTSDAQALLLAKHFDRLSGFCLVSTTSYAALLDIVSKDGLYRRTGALGLGTVPYVITREINEVVRWTQANLAPYLVKPFYEGIGACRLRQKSLLLSTRETLLAYVAEHGTESVIIQRMLRGGDGSVFDCYGFCDRHGRTLAMASHRRWRQSPSDFGSTSFGEIPANLDQETEAALFKDSKQLLASTEYHGIFGIEWLREQDTGVFYVIDFNARPFTTIGHLTACGLNLPALAYSDLIGQEPAGAEPRPSLKRLLWVDLLSDIESFSEKRRNNRIGFAEWLMSILACRSFAYLNWRDPIPGIDRLGQIANRLLWFALKQVTRSSAPS